MRKGPLFLGIGVFLILISIPTALAFTLYDSKEIRKHDFVEEDDHSFYFEFDDIGPGKITIEGRSMFLSSDVLMIRLEDKDGRLIFTDEMGVGGLFGSDVEIDIKDKGDYKLIIEVESEPELTDFQVTYTGKNSTFGLLMFIIGFPLFLISGLISGIVGIVLMVRFKRTGSETSPHKKLDELYYDNLEDYYEDVDEEREFTGYRYRYYDDRDHIRTGPSRYKGSRRRGYDDSEGRKNKRNKREVLERDIEELQELDEFEPPRKKKTVEAKGRNGALKKKKVSDKGQIKKKRKKTSKVK